MAPYLAVVSGIASGMASYRSSQAQAQQLEAQAKQDEIQGRSDAVEYKRQANEILRRNNVYTASNIAKAGARGLNPFASGGVTDMINTYNTRYAYKDYFALQDNALMAKEMSKYQAGQRRAGAKSIRQIAPLQFLGAVAGSMSQGYQINPNMYGNMFNLNPSPTSVPGVNTSLGISPNSSYSRYL